MGGWPSTKGNSHVRPAPCAQRKEEVVGLGLGQVAKAIFCALLYPSCQDPSWPHVANASPSPFPPKKSLEVFPTHRLLVSKRSGARQRGDPEKVLVKQVVLGSQCQRPAVVVWCGCSWFVSSISQSFILSASCCPKQPGPCAPISLSNERLHSTPAACCCSFALGARPLTPGIASAAPVLTLAPLLAPLLLAPPYPSVHAALLRAVFPCRPCCAVVKLCAAAHPLPAPCLHKLTNAVSSAPSPFSQPLPCSLLQCAAASHLPAPHLYRPMKTGMVARVGRQPARGFTPAAWYRRAVSSCRVLGSLAYFACSSFTLGCRACSATVDATCRS